MDPLDKKNIEAVFQQPVHQIYQATEGFLGTTCKHGTLHLNEDLLVIQKKYIDETSGRFQPIITDFNRTTQPILRYLLNDMLIEKKQPCPCGSLFTAIECVEGRSDDIFYLQSVSGGYVTIFPDFIRKEIISANANIREYFVIQHSLSDIEIFLDFIGTEKLQVQQTIVMRLQALFQGLKAIFPKIKFTDNHAWDKKTKLRRIERRFSFD